MNIKYNTAKADMRQTVSLQPLGQQSSVLSLENPKASIEKLYEPIEFVTALISSPAIFLIYS